MKKGILAVSFFPGVLLALTPAQAQEMAAPKLAAVVNLENRLEGKPTATVKVGGGVTLVIAAMDKGLRQDLTILADGVQVQKLEGGKFIACARLESGPVTYWAISEYTGGAHCCGQFAFLARAAAGGPVRHLGQTKGYNGGPRDFPGSFIHRQVQLYFESFDNRFDYFHAGHADCLLVNVPRTYYRLTPTGLTLNNLPFKDVYMKEAAAVNQKIHRRATPRMAKPKPSSGRNLGRLSRTRCLPAVSGSSWWSAPSSISTPGKTKWPGTRSAGCVPLLRNLRLGTRVAAGDFKDLEGGPLLISAVKSRA